MPIFPHQNQSPFKHKEHHQNKLTSTKPKYLSIIGFKNFNFLVRDKSDKTFIFANIYHENNTFYLANRPFSPQ